MAKLTKAVTYPEVIQEVYDDKAIRILYSKNRDKIIQLEYQYIHLKLEKRLPDGELVNGLFTPDAYIKKPDYKVDYIVKELVDKIARAFYKSKKGKTRLSLADLESAGYEKAWEVILNYSFNDKYWLYQRLIRGIKTRCIDVLRGEGLTNDRSTHKNNNYHRTVSMSEVDKTISEASIGPLNCYIKKEIVSEMFNDVDLAIEERQLLAIIYDYPSGSLRDWGKELEVEHPETVRRLFKSLKKKLSKYNLSS